MDNIAFNVIELSRTLLADLFIASLKNIVAIKGKGEVNDVYLLESYSNKYILRINSVHELDRFKKEQWCYERTRENEVSGPQVYAVGKTEDFAYMLLEFIEGSNGEAIHASLSVWKTLGRHLKNIHNISTNGFGENLDDRQNGGRKQWTNYLDDNFKSLVDREFVELGIIDSVTSQKLAETIANLKQKEFVFGLNHGDYSLANVVVNELENPYVIDWGNAQAHIVPHFDLSVILDESLSDDSPEFLALLKGYGLTFEQYLEIKEEIKAIRLLEAIDKLRWALERSPGDVEYYKNRIRRLTSQNLGRFI